LLQNLLSSAKYKTYLKGEDEDWDELDKIVKTYVRPDDLLPFKKLIYGVAQVYIPPNEDGGPFYGTAFLANVPNVGVCLLSAGHNFAELFREVEYDDGGEKKTRKMNSDEILEELGKFKVWFGNTDGVLMRRPDDMEPCPWRDQGTTLEGGKPMNLKLFLEKFDFCGSTSYGGERAIFRRGPSGFQAWVENDSNSQGDDYFAMRLCDNIRTKLDEYGLEILECGRGKELENEIGGKNRVVALVGHPGYDDWKNWPLRLSYGKEIDQMKTKTGPFLHFNYDSLGGHSGSPVFGRGYKIKGIHVGAAYGIKNRAYKISKINDCIRLGQEKNVQ